MRQESLSRLITPFGLAEPFAPSDKGTGPSAPGV